MTNQKMCGIPLPCRSHSCFLHRGSSVDIVLNHSSTIDLMCSSEAEENSIFLGLIKYSKDLS